MGTKNNIIVGGVTNVKVAGYGVVEGSATDIGFTSEGVTCNVPREYFDYKVDQVCASIGKKMTDMKVLLTLIMAETTLDNLRLAMDLPATALVGTKLTLSPDVTENDKTIYLNGLGVSGGTVKLTLHRAVIIGSAEHAYAKDGSRQIAVEVEALADTLNSNEFGTYEQTGSDVTAPTVAMTAPADGGNVTGGASDTVTLTITEAGFIDEATVEYGATVMIFDVEAPAAVTLVAGTIVFDQTAKTIIFTPDAVWVAAGNNYQVTVTTALADDAGNTLAVTFIGHFVSA